MIKDLHTAARDGDLQALSESLQQGADVNSRDKLQRTPLHLACWAGHTEFVKVLIALPELKLHQNATDEMSAMHFAAQKGHTEIVRILINSGMSVDRKTWKGITCLHIACQKGYKDLAELLLARKASPFVVDKREETALKKCQTDELRELIEAEISKQAEAGSQFNSKRSRPKKEMKPANSDEDSEDEGITFKKPTIAKRPAASKPRIASSRASLAVASTDAPVSHRPHIAACPIASLSEDTSNGSIAGKGQHALPYPSCSAPQDGDRCAETGSDYSHAEPAKIEESVDNPSDGVVPVATRPPTAGGPVSRPPVAGGPTSRPHVASGPRPR